MFTDDHVGELESHGHLLKGFESSNTSPSSVRQGSQVTILPFVTLRGNSSLYSQVYEVETGTPPLPFLGRKFTIIRENAYDTFGLACIVVSGKVLPPPPLPKSALVKVDRYVCACADLRTSRPLRQYPSSAFIFFTL